MTSFVLNSIVGVGNIGYTGDPEFPLACYEGIDFHDVAIYPLATSLSASVRGDGGVPVDDIAINTTPTSIDIYGQISGAFKNQWEWKTPSNGSMSKSYNSNDVDTSNSGKLTALIHEPVSFKFVYIDVSGTEDQDGVPTPFTVTLIKRVLQNYDADKAKVKQIVGLQTVF